MPRRNDCPVCSKPVDPEHKPFCSRGCRDRDLLKWMGEGYRIPAGSAEIDPDGNDPGLDRHERDD